jgi:Glycosyl hydrolases family 39
MATTLLWAICASGDTTVILAGRPTPVPASLFSLNILFHPLTKVPWPAVPFGGWRMSHVNWPDLEPQKGNWNFTLLDRYVEWGQQHHVQILMALTYTPQWASSTPDARTDSQPGISGVPRDMDDWRTFVRTVATRYQGRIQQYEIWNEPNRPQSWAGDVDTMIVMTREASTILKQIDPATVVVAPAPEEEKGLPWLNEFLRKGGGQYVDAISYHFYVGMNPPEALIPLIQKVEHAMKQYHLEDKPLWNTEAGWLGPNPLTSSELPAAYLARAYVLNWAAGVSRFYWFAWENHHFAPIELIEKDNVTLLPAGKAYGMIEQWMVGAVVNRCAGSGDGTWICDLDRNGNLSYIVWNTAGNKSFSIPSDWRVSQITSLSGANNESQDHSITIGVQPVLIR